MGKLVDRGTHLEYIFTTEGEISSKKGSRNKRKRKYRKLKPRAVFFAKEKMDLGIALFKFGYIKTFKKRGA